MKITFLGTSHGLVEKGRNRTSTMVEIGDSIYLIDVGAPVYEILLNMGVSLDKIKAVFTTHAHGDHVLGLLPLLEIANWSSNTINFEVYLTDQKLKSAITDTLEVVCDKNLDSDRLRLKVYDENTIYDDGDLKVVFAKNCHYAGGKPSYSLTLFAEGKSVVFSGDLSGHLSMGDFPKLPKDCDLLVLELAHIGLEDIKPYLENADLKEICFNHVFPQSKFNEIEKLKGTYPFKVSAPKDLDEIIL